jgi:hypothetical protein
MREAAEGKQSAAEMLIRSRSGLAFCGCPGAYNRPEEPMTSNAHEHAITDVLMLAGVDRAEHHRKREDPPGVPVWTALEHLDIRRRTKRTRHVRARLDPSKVGDSGLASSM